MPPALDEQRARICDQDGKPDQDDVFGLPAHVKIHAAGQQSHPLDLLRQQKIQKRDDGEIDQKVDGIKLHGTKQISSRRQRSPRFHRQKNAPPKFSLGGAENLGRHAIPSQTPHTARELPVCPPYLSSGFMVGNKILLSPSRLIPLRSAQNPHNCWVFETIYHPSCVLLGRPLHSKSCIKIVVVCRRIFL